MVSPFASARSKKMKNRRKVAINEEIPVALRRERLGFTDSCYCMALYKYASYDYKKKNRTRSMREVGYG